MMWHHTSSLPRLLLFYRFLRILTVGMKQHSFLHAFVREKNLFGTSHTSLSRAEFAICDVPPSFLPVLKEHPTFWCNFFSFFFDRKQGQKELTWLLSSWNEKRAVCDLFAIVLIALDLQTTDLKRNPFDWTLPLPEFQLGGRHGICSRFQLERTWIVIFGTCPGSGVEIWLVNVAF